jgi:hypothetical protein
MACRRAWKISLVARQMEGAVVAGSGGRVPQLREDVFDEQGGDEMG